jgi:hypothetical protein
MLWGTGGCSRRLAINQASASDCAHTGTRTDYGTCQPGNPEPHVSAKAPTHTLFIEPAGQGNQSHKKGTSKSRLKSNKARLSEGIGYSMTHTFTYLSDSTGYCSDAGIPN